MTGYGSADGKVLGGRLRIEIRTVNHRHFNPQLKLPREVAGIESELRDRLRQRLERGHVAVTARWVERTESAGGLAVDVERARQVLAAAKDLKQKLKLKGDLDLAFVARQPDVFVFKNGDGAAATWDDVQDLVERAAREVLVMREREGKALAVDLTQRLDTLAAQADRIAERAPQRLTAEYARLKQAAAELTGGVKGDEQPLAQELAQLADPPENPQERGPLPTPLTAARH